MVIGITSILDTLEIFLGAGDLLEDSGVSESCVAPFTLLELGKMTLETTEIFLGKEVTDVFLDASDANIL